MLRDQLWDDMEAYSKQTYTSDGEAACIMHSITQLLDSRSQCYEPDLDKEHARGLFSDLIIASISTTTNFTYALPNILLHNPRVLRRIQQEVDDVIGPDRRPSIFDRDAMPYSVATILELLRYASLVISVPHLTLENTTIGEHPLPAGTIIFQLIPAIMLDKFWGDPEVFRPEPFLDDDTGALLPGDHPNRKHMLEFGAGPRMCVGEAFAQKRMFIFLTSLLQAFDLQPGNDPLVPCDYSSFVMKGLLCQRPYSVKLTARKRN
jgi:cytochrome P450